MLEFFENVWAMRNDILHRGDSAGTKMTSKHLTEELLDFKYNATKYLRQGDRGQIDYPLWTQRSKVRSRSLGSQLSDRTGRMTSTMSHAPGATDGLGE